MKNIYFKIWFKPFRLGELFILYIIYHGCNPWKREQPVEKNKFNPFRVVLWIVLFATGFTGGYSGFDHEVVL